MPTLSKGATVAVTGANGFIGAWVCAELLAQGFQVRAVVRDASDDAKYGFLLSLPGTCSTPCFGCAHCGCAPCGYVHCGCAPYGCAHHYTRYLHSLPPYSPLYSPYLCPRHAHHYTTSTRYHLTCQVLAAAG